jgi:hypothetical protein
MTADPPVGLPFSRVYGRPDKLLENSERLRNRIATQVDLIFFPGDKARECLAQLGRLARGGFPRHRQAHLAAQRSRPGGWN